MVDESISRAIDNDHTAAIKVTSDGRKISRKKDGNVYATQSSFFICTICKKVFKSHHLYRKHLKIHSDKSYICQVCNKGFVHKHYLHNHMSVHNIGKSPFSCHVCPKRFSHKNNLTQHLKFHASKKPFQCEMCAKEFYQQEHLRAHLRHHNNERPFQCEVCNKSFNIKSSLQRHMNCHTGAKPFICDICHRGYTRRSVLMLHVQQVHENKKPYQCSECQTCFSQKGNLQAHFRRKHLQPKMDNKRGNQREKMRRTIRKQSFKQSPKSVKLSPLKTTLFSDMFSNTPKKANKITNMDFISLNRDMIKVERETQTYDNAKLALQAVNGITESQLSLNDQDLSEMCMSLASEEDTNNFLCKLSTTNLENGTLFRFLNSNDEALCNTNGNLADLQDNDDSMASDQMLTIPDDLKAMYEFDISSDPKDWENYLLADSDILNPYDSEILSLPTKNNPSIVIKTEPPEEDTFPRDPIYLCHDYASPPLNIGKRSDASAELRDIPSGCSRTTPMKKTIESNQVKKKQKNYPFIPEKQPSETKSFKVLCV